MKRIGKILSLSVMLVLLATSFSFAQGLTLESIYPEDGDDTLQSTNVAVKMVFSENMTSEEAQAANEDCFKITNKDGDTISYTTLYNAEKYPNEIWLQITEKLTDNTEYTLKISGDIVSSAGNTLDDSMTISFSTRNAKQDNNVYMILMFVMMGAMIAFTAWDTRHKLKKQAAEKEEEAKLNPYKEAKKTGKSVEEIVAKVEHEKAKAEKQRAKRAKDEDDEEEEDETPVSSGDGTKKVKAKRPISAIGIATPASIIAKRQAREAAAAKAKAKAEARKQGVSKSKGSKQQQRKKK